MKFVEINTEAYPIYRIEDIYLCECLTFTHWLLSLDGELAIIVNDKRFHFLNKNDRKQFLNGFFLAYDNMNEVSDDV